ncbi:COX15/CtaA family protein [Nesterenkonia sp. LB17]|uniref:COX15/CtaA family protein n=1 Tax=unclassified Nesterenkonia TaxID=2629769 RepID=UPI001F4D1132|nr:MULTISPECIES: COX15/CtaA family protein [unclassified Nesterenkonia]MCH8561253.1 COX15/CtaA family protein [Nesterenkonia sp. DZ6]MCH8565370.1 COX15/CtaA family protein [Nesterenkonia sp. LB17]MCH8571288.1 COX15/CtaA family protein [Nesterenkonia sp. AY15]
MNAIEVFRTNLPTRITRVTKVLAWATLISNIGIILTGGAVRLTASGLGCPEWPRCTPESWVATQEMGLHGAIEFGNRLLTYVLVLICALMFFALLRMRRSHRPLFRMSLVILAGIPLQAVIGGITVWTNLNPWIVALHFLLSAGLVMVATMLLNRIRLELRSAQDAAAQDSAADPAADPAKESGPRDGVAGIRMSHGASDAVTSAMAPVILAATWVSVFLGTVVTGTGPHAGDPGSPRHLFDPDLVTRMHVAPVYVLCFAAIALLVRQYRISTAPNQRRSAWWLMAVIIAQGIIGYVQHFTGLPIILVGLHMLGSALLVVTATAVFDSYRARYVTRGLTRSLTPVAAAAGPQTEPAQKS